MKKRLIGLMLAAAMALALAACGKDTDAPGSDGGDRNGETELTGSGSADGNQGTDAAGGDNAGGTDAAGAGGKHHVEITMKDYGTISVELDADAAPITVENFLKLAGEGFYDGLTFHRIIPGFMIQGGDPNGNGTGGSDENIKGEFSENGVENNLSHTRGAISMARATPPDSASSQFFIVHQDSTFLDGQYACFGYVTEGIEVVDSICDMIGSNELVEKESQPVIESIKVVD